MRYEYIKATSGDVRLSAFGPSPPTPTADSLTTGPRPGGVPGVSQSTCELRAAARVKR